MSGITSLTLTELAAQAHALNRHHAAVEGTAAEGAAWDAYEAVRTAAMGMQAASLADVLILASFARTEACHLGGFVLLEEEVVAYSDRLTAILSEIMIGLCRFGGVPEVVAAADNDAAAYLENGGIVRLRAAAVAMRGAA